MADDLITLADMVGNSLDVSDEVTSNLLQDAPFFASLMGVESSNGDTHKYVRETGAPTVGFRAVNAGRDLDSSTTELVTVTLKLLDFSFAVDKGAADTWIKGPQEYIQMEGMRHVAAALFAAEQQYINGTVGGSASGFAGFADALDDSDDTGVVDAGGTTASTGSSIYLVRAGVRDIQGVYATDGLALGETIVQDMVDGSGKHFPVYYTPGCAHIGIQIGGQYSLVRICNVTEDATKGATDDLIYSAFAEFPAGRGPTHILMNRRSRKQLRESRTSTNVTGAPAPTPLEVEGVPIITTDAIGSTETLLTAA